MRVERLGRHVLDVQDRAVVVEEGDQRGVGGGEGGVERAHDTKTLIRFDLGLLNLTSAGVGSATINLYGVPSLSPFESPSAEHPVTTDLFQVLNAWNESSVTWETAPMTAMAASSSTVQSSVNGWVSFDATALVRS
mgnify:CR=1 FL=1